MKSFALTLMLSLAMLSAAAQNITPSNQKYTFTEASDLTVIGKLFDTPVPYARVDTVKYKGWTKTQNFQVRCASGIAIVFRTNSSSIMLKPEYGQLYYGVTTNVLAHRGFDLYIKENGKWLWAAAASPAEGKHDQPFILASNLDGQMHECLMYLPLYSEIKGLEIGVDEGSVLEPSPEPFRHRVGIYGSSYTHGVSCGRAGMTYPAIFTRDTGIQLLSLGMSGQCKMQPYAADALMDAKVDAFIFDTFSNPSLAEIRQRLFPFIEKMQASHPGAPLIFQRTIYRENRNFNTKVAYDESTRIALVDSMMAVACKKYKDVYYIYPDASAKDHEAQIDGTHPSNYGYQLWAKSIEKKVCRILRKYGIK